MVMMDDFIAFYESKAREKSPETGAPADAQQVGKPITPYSPERLL